MKVLALGMLKIDWDRALEDAERGPRDIKEEGPAMIKLSDLKRLFVRQPIPKARTYCRECALPLEPDGKCPKPGCPGSRTPLGRF